VIFSLAVGQAACVSISFPGSSGANVYSYVSSLIKPHDVLSCAEVDIEIRRLTRRNIAVAPSFISSLRSGGEYVGRTASVTSSGSNISAANGAGLIKRADVL